MREEICALCIRLIHSLSIRTDLQCFCCLLSSPPFPTLPWRSNQQPENSFRRAAVFSCSITSDVSRHKARCVGVAGGGVGWGCDVMGSAAAEQIGSDETNCERPRCHREKVRLRCDRVPQTMTSLSARTHASALHAHSQGRSSVELWPW